MTMYCIPCRCNIPPPYTFGIGATKATPSSLGEDDIAGPKAEAQDPINHSVGFKV